jgi:hypothetical protein
MTARIASILPVWIVVIIGIVLVAVLEDPAGRFRWLSIVFAFAILLSFVLQLALSQKEGLVVRMATSVAGSLILLAVATAIFLLTST